MVRPGEVLDELHRLVGALEPHGRSALGPTSPVLRARGAGIDLVPLRLSVAALRGAGRRHGGTVNDVFVAGLLDGLARYHTKHGSGAPSLRLGFPISRRGSGGVAMHNQLLGAVVAAPLGYLEFGERVRLVHESLRLAREQPWSGVADDLAEAGSRLPGTDGALAALMSSIDVLASNVVGPPAPMWLAGVPVTAMTPVGPRAGAAVNATLLSYGDAAHVGLNLDPAAVSDPEVLSDCLAAAFDEGLGAPF